MPLFAEVEDLRDELIHLRSSRHTASAEVLRQLRGEEGIQLVGAGSVPEPPGDRTDEAVVLVEDPVGHDAEEVPLVEQLTDGGHQRGDPTAPRTVIAPHAVSAAVLTVAATSPPPEARIF